MDVLFPTLEELESLRRALDPMEQALDLLALMLRYPAEGSMAEFYMESQDPWEFEYDEEETEFVIDLGEKVSWDEI
jgi:hypothetical protein